jgi:hypothetical protein
MRIQRSTLPALTLVATFAVCLAQAEEPNTQSRECAPKTLGTLKQEVDVAVLYLANQYELSPDDLLPYKGCVSGEVVEILVIAKKSDAAWCVLLALPSRSVISHRSWH